MLFDLLAIRNCNKLLNDIVCCATCMLHVHVCYGICTEYFQEIFSWQTNKNWVFFLFGIETFLLLEYYLVPKRARRPTISVRNHVTSENWRYNLPVKLVYCITHYKHILRKSHMFLQIIQNVGRKWNSAHFVGYYASIKEHVIINRLKKKKKKSDTL